MLACVFLLLIFFFNDTATTEIYTLSLHDALPIYVQRGRCLPYGPLAYDRPDPAAASRTSSLFLDRKSTRLNSSHSQISYAVFCLKKKNHQPVCDLDAVFYPGHHHAANGRGAANGY